MASKQLHPVTHLHDDPVDNWCEIGDFVRCAAKRVEAQRVAQKRAEAEFVAGEDGDFADEDFVMAYVRFASC
tara:strand:+ start:2294 stop:2509 length:216 start_codon:yes stop_codon:yes gene_type:complete